MAPAERTPSIKAVQLVSRTGQIKGTAQRATRIKK